MKTKTLIAALLTAACCMTMLTACSGSSENSGASSEASQTSQTEKSASASDASQTDSAASGEESEESKESDGKTHTLFIRDGDKCEKLTASFLNTASMETKEAELKKTAEEADYFSYKIDEDATKYNMVRLTYGDVVTDYVAFNPFVNGWYLKDGALLPCVEGKEPNYDPAYETKTFQFDGFDKNVYIWKPTDYDAGSDEKYSVIYMFDGQNVISSKIANQYNLWNSCQHVESMMSLTDNKAIIVAIDNSDDRREDELIPDLGEVTYNDVNSKKHGADFAEFIVDTIVPYIEETYSVYTDPAHNAIAGSSFGGLASFYVGLQHPEKFGTIGAFSASFGVFGEKDWKAYLGSKTFDENSPFIYMYAGSYAGDTGSVDQLMNDELIESMGYPKNKIVFSKNEIAEHKESAWRNAYPEFLEAMFTGQVSALENGAKVDYVDKLNHSDGDKTVSDSVEYEALTGELANYVYYDNSETKWDKVYVYLWGGFTTNRLTGKVLTEEDAKMWPGQEMERIEGTDIYRFPTLEGTGGVIFNNGVSDEEVKEGVLCYQTYDLVYSAAICAGRVYRIDTTQEAKQQRGWEKSKYKYPAGSWSEYKES